MSFKVDMHTHSYYSDGTLSPAELVVWAENNGLDILSITDHDGVEGMLEAKAAATGRQLKLVPGIELSTQTDEGIEIHILGYEIDTENEELLALCEKAKEERKIRNRKLIDAISKIYDITMEDVIERKGQSFVGKPHIAKALCIKGYINSPQDAFADDGVFEMEGIKDIKQVHINTVDAINIIANAGGIPVLAHPGKIKEIGEKESDEFFDNLDILVKKLKLSGLKGMECIYPKHSDKERLKFIDIAEKYHLHITEGSDFHGPQQ